MGAASCKNSKSPQVNQQKNDNKNIIIGVFGLDDAGKTSTIKAIEGEPTDNVLPTISSVSTTVKNPLNEKNKDQQRIKIIDVSGERKFRQKSWSQYYDQIHGLIFVIDASEKRRLNENQETLEELLENEKLKNKPILILANKQDQKGAINTENNLKRQLDIEKLKTKHKIELCTALPQKQKNKVDESIRKGFSWLIRTIDENYTELNARITKKNRFNIDENDSDDRYSKTRNTDHRLKITSEKLPSITTNRNKTRVYSDDDDDNQQNSSSTAKDFNKKKKVLGVINSNQKPIKKSNDNEPKPFRSTYESFPEETPWVSSSSALRSTKSEDTLPRLYSKPSLTNDTKRRDMSPLVHDTKFYTNGSLSKRDRYSDDETDFNHQQKSKSTNRFSSNIKKSTSGIYDDDDDDDDDYNNNRRNITTTKKTYNHDDDDEENNYLKKSTTTTKFNKNYDYDDNKSYQRSSNQLNRNNEYRGTLSHSKYDDEDDYLTSKPVIRSTYNNDYSNSKSTNRSKYNDDDDDDDDYPTRHKSHSKFEDDDYPISKSTTRTKYNDDDDDVDDYYSNSTKKNNIRSENNDFFTTKVGTNRFKKTTDYDS